MLNIFPYNGRNPVIYNNKIYWVNRLHNGINYNLCEADFLYKGKWHKVRNTQILIDLRRNIDFYLKTTVQN